VSEPALLVADVLVLMGVAAMAIAVFGAIRLPNPYARLHSASKAVVLGVLAILLASCPSGDGPLMGRCLLVGVFALLTSPVGSHALARMQYLETGAGGPPIAAGEEGPPDRK
jgi:multicomponent Na+:H+ antiporter subunit G